MCFSATDISQMEVWISQPVVTNLPELQDLLQFVGYAFNSDLSGSAGYIGDQLLLNGRKETSVFKHFREVKTRDGRGGAFSSGAGRGRKSAGRGLGENLQGGAGQKNGKSTDPKIQQKCVNGDIGSVL